MRPDFTSPENKLKDVWLLEVEDYNSVPNLLARKIVFVFMGAYFQHEIGYLHYVSTRRLFFPNDEHETYNQRLNFISFIFPGDKLSTLVRLARQLNYSKSINFQIKRKKKLCTSWSLNVGFFRINILNSAQCSSL